MADPRSLAAQRISLVDAVDTLLNKGVVLSGDVVLSVAGVDLVYVGLNLLVASVESLREAGSAPSPIHLSERGGGRIDAGTSSLPDAKTGRDNGEMTFDEGAGLSASDLALYPDRQRRDATPSPPESATAIIDHAPPAGQIDVAGERPEQGLARLVLTLIELLRQILERQALRRAEGGGLTDDEVERMGVALMELEAKMRELRDSFGLTQDDLSIDLGPLGRLL